MSPRTLASTLAALALLVPACGDDDGGGGAESLGSATSPVTEVAVTAPGQRFEPDTVFVPAGEEVTLTFENEDDGVAHNLRIRTDEAEDDQPATELEVGPDTQELSFTLAAGEYRFVCDIHPNMRGDITAV